MPLLLGVGRVDGVAELAQLLLHRLAREHELRAERREVRSDRLEGAQEAARLNVALCGGERPRDSALTRKSMCESARVRYEEPHRDAMLLYA